VSRLARLIVPTAAAIGLMLSTQPATVSAHPLGNFTVNRALAITIDEGVEVLAVLDMAEIPAYETIRDLDVDGDDKVSGPEGASWAVETCTAWRAAINVSIDGETTTLRPSGEPALSFPAGAGGLATLRLECRSAVEITDAGGERRLAIVDVTADERVGWREISADVAGDATITERTVPSDSPTSMLTVYPEADLAEPLDVRAGSLVFRLGTAAGGAPGTSPAIEVRETASDPLAALIGGELSPLVFVLAILLSVGLGGAHALSPGHGKTLVAAYVIGAGGSARAAVQIGLWVAISHTAGVFVLGVVTLLAGQYLLPERLIGWLSLGSGVIVTGLGLVLLVRAIAARRALRRGSPGHHHAHDHDHDHGGSHHHDHPSGVADHGHSHEVPAPGELSWRTAIALGFAGGAVPSASALIVLLVAVSTDRVLLGAVLIGCFGIGMAAVLGGLAYAVARVRSLASSPNAWSSRPVVRRALALAPTAAGVVVLVSGVAFTAAAVSQLA
jgi:ABC-type nickel/cobalt efflux system permease component RcnA